MRYHPNSSGRHMVAVASLLAGVDELHEFVHIKRLRDELADRLRIFASQRGANGIRGCADDDDASQGIKLMVLDLFYHLFAAIGNPQALTHPLAAIHA